MRLSEARWEAPTDYQGKSGRVPFLRSFQNRRRDEQKRTASLMPAWIPWTRRLAKWTSTPFAS